MAYDIEEESFRDFLRLFPENATLLIDTYDTLAAIDKIIESGLRPQAVRLDSGNVIELSREVRRRLDQGGLEDTRIFATSDLDEYVITEMLAHGAQVDTFGVGSSLTTSKDAPSLGGVYKLVDVNSAEGLSPRAKLSEGKTSYPGCKQVFRREERDGKYGGDVVARCTEDFKGSTPLLACVMRGGKRTGPTPMLDRVREHAHKELGKLPDFCRRLHNPVAYPVHFSHELQILLEEFRSQMKHPKAAE